MKKPKTHSESNNPIAVIVGSGSIPALLIAQLKQNQKNFVIICLHNNASKEIAKGEKHIWIALGEIKKALDFLKSNHVKEIIFAGKVQRPSLLSMKIDMKALALLGNVGMEMFKAGDDKILSSVIKLLEEHGFAIVAPENFLPSLLAPSGVLSKIKPSEQDCKDIEAGKKILKALGSSDVGQAIIVEDGYVLGIEAAEGTDKLIERCKILRKEKSASGVLIKMKKQAQETRVDLPGIGTKTISQAHNAGLKGIAFEAGGSIIVDVDAVTKKADELKLFLLGTCIVEK